MCSDQYKSERLSDYDENSPECILSNCLPRNAKAISHGSEPISALFLILFLVPLLVPLLFKRFLRTLLSLA